MSEELTAATSAQETARRAASSPASRLSDPKTWVEEHGNYLFRYALIRVRHETVAEDLVQDTLLAALQGQDRFSGQSSERSWLTGILKHKLLDHFRRQARERTVNVDDSMPEELEARFDDLGLWKREPESGPTDFEKSSVRILAPPRSEGVNEQNTTLLPQAEPLAGGVPTPGAGVDYDWAVEQFYQALYKFAFGLVGSETDAADLTQDTYRVMLIKGAAIRDSRKVKSWLFTTLYRQFLGRRRHATRFPEMPVESAEWELPTITPRHAETLDGSLVVAALQQLEEKYRAPLAMFYLEELSSKEMAEVLGLPNGMWSLGKALPPRFLGVGQT